MEKGQGLLLLHQQCHLFHNQHLKTSSNPCSNPCVVTTVNLPVLNQKLVSTAARNLRREHSQGRRVRICRREHCETQRRWDGARDATGPRFVFCLHKAFRDSKRVLKRTEIIFRWLFRRNTTVDTNLSFKTLLSILHPFAYPLLHPTQRSEQLETPGAVACHWSQSPSVQGDLGACSVSAGGFSSGLSY